MGSARRVDEDGGNGAAVASSTVHSQQEHKGGNWRQAVGKGQEEHQTEDDGETWNCPEDNSQKEADVHVDEVGDVEQLLKSLDE